MTPPTAPNISYTVIKLDLSRLDAASVPQFRQQMNEVISQGYRQVLLDLSDISFIDSSGLGALVATLKTLSHGRELILCGAGENALHLFKLTRMDRVFRLYPDVDAALDKLNAN